jgi:hypothetical protein
MAAFGAMHSPAASRETRFRSGTRLGRDRSSDPKRAECEHASVRVHAASLLAIGSKQKFAALRARYSIVAQAATGSALPLQTAAGSEQKSGYRPGGPASWPLLRESGSAADFA